MAEGDYFFSNVVAKLNGAFEAAFIAYAEERRVTGGLGDAPLDTLVHSRGAREDWMRRYMPRTLRLLVDFRHDSALNDVIEALQTAPYQGGDVNNALDSAHVHEFQEAVVLLFTNVARTRSYPSEGDLSPHIRRVRRAFFHMTHPAKDPGALMRLLERYEHGESELARVDASVEEVRGSLAWGRCERIFRTAAAELLRLST